MTPVTLNLDVDVQSSVAGSTDGKESAAADSDGRKISYGHDARDDYNASHAERYQDWMFAEPDFNTSNLLTPGWPDWLDKLETANIRNKVDVYSNVRPKPLNVTGGFQQFKRIYTKFYEIDDSKLLFPEDMPEAEKATQRVVRRDYLSMSDTEQQAVNDAFVKMKHTVSPRPPTWFNRSQTPAVWNRYDYWTYLHYMLSQNDFSHSWNVRPVWMFHHRKLVSLFEYEMQVITNNPSFAVPYYNSLNSHNRMDIFTTKHFGRSQKANSYIVSIR